MQHINILHRDPILYMLYKLDTDRYWKFCIMYTITLNFICSDVRIVLLCHSIKTVYRLTKYKVSKYISPEYVHT